MTSLNQGIIPIYNFNVLNEKIYSHTKCYFTGFKKAGMYVLLRYVRSSWVLFNCSRLGNKYKQFNLRDELINISNKLNKERIYQCYLYHKNGSVRKFKYCKIRVYKLRIIDILDNNLTFSQRIDELNILRNTINNKIIKISKYWISSNEDEFCKINEDIKKCYCFHHIIINNDSIPVYLKFKNF